MAFAILLVKYLVMRKELTVISVGIAIAASVLYSELKPVSSTPVQLAGVSYSATPQSTQPAQSAQSVQTPQANQKMMLKTVVPTTQNISNVVHAKPTINQNGSSGENEDGEDNN